MSILFKNINTNENIMNEGRFMSCINKVKLMSLHDMIVSIKFSSNLKNIYVYLNDKFIHSKKYLNIKIFKDDILFINYVFEKNKIIDYSFSKIKNINYDKKIHDILNFYKLKNDSELLSLIYSKKNDIQTSEILLKMLENHDIDKNLYFESIIKKTNYLVLDDIKHVNNKCKNIYDLNKSMFNSINKIYIENNECEIKKPVIIFFSMIDYYYRIQRNQHICLNLSKRGYKVFYVRTTFNENFLENNINENLIEIHLDNDITCSIYSSSLNIDNVKSLLLSIDKLKKKYNFDFFISYVANPFWYQVLKYVNNTHIIYDCVDYHAGFDNISDKIIKNEHELLNKCDTLVLTSPILSKKLNVKNYNLIRNGVEFNYFNNIKKLKSSKKIIGYYGAISDWFDVDLVEKIIKTYHNCEIHLIGSVYCENKEHQKKIENLSKYSNVKLFGEIPYTNLKNYICYFDVGLIPFIISPLIECTNPVKLYEMLACGIPIVLSNLNDVLTLNRENLYYISNTHENFISNIQNALNENNLNICDERVKFSSQNDWINTTSLFENLINKATPLISIVLLCFNNWNLTKECINSVIKNTNYFNYELIIVNNFSSDETKNELSKYKNINNIKIIHNKQNYGFAKGMNIGSLHCNGEYIVLLNNDTVCFKNWLYPLIKPYFKDKNCGVVSPITNNCGNDVKQFLSFENINELYEKVDNLQFNKKNTYIGIDKTPFFCPIIKKKDFYRAGLLDVNFGRGGWEDDDLLYRFKLMNKNNYFTYASFVFHHESATMGNSSYVDNSLNKIYYESKWNVKWNPPCYFYKSLKINIPDNDYLINLIEKINIFTKQKTINITNKNYNITITSNDSSVKNINFYENNDNIYFDNICLNKNEWNILKVYSIFYTKYYCSNKHL